MALGKAVMAILPPLTSYAMNTILHVVTIIIFTIMLKKKNPALSYRKCFDLLVKKLVIDNIHDKLTIKQNMALKALLSLAFVTSTTGISAYATSCTFETSMAEALFGYELEPAVTETTTLSYDFGQLVDRRRRSVGQISLDLAGSTEGRTTSRPAMVFTLPNTMTETNATTSTTSTSTTSTSTSTTSTTTTSTTTTKRDA